MPFSNPIVGGETLVIPAIKSPNYTAGVSGWRIARDGTVEFNNGQFRGSIEVGPNPGEHFIVNNSATGDPMDIYDSNNKLIFSIDNSGRLTSYSPGSLADPYVRLTSGMTQFNNGSGFTTVDPPSISAPVISTDTTELDLYAGSPDGNSHAAGLQLFGGTSDAGAEMRASQRGVSGDVLQLDTSNNDRQLVHAAVYHLTTDASGNCTFNHGAAFTPMLGFLAPTSVAGADFYQYAWLGSPFTSTQASAHFNDRLGANKASTSFFVFGVFYG